MHDARPSFIDKLRFYKSYVFPPNLNLIIYEVTTIYVKDKKEWITDTFPLTLRTIHANDPNKRTVEITTKTKKQAKINHEYVVKKVKQQRDEYVEKLKNGR